MAVNFLENNPFYVLEVLSTDKRTTIVSKAEEKAFFLDENACTEAQSSLLNPAKRLSAEMDWFCNSDKATVSGIRASIENHTAISIDKLTGLDKLNATLFNFMISSFEDYFEIGYAILDMDEQYSNIKSDSLTEVVNVCHAKAGVLPVSDDEIERELNRKREQIQHSISNKIAGLNENDYIEFITILAEKCIEDEDYSDNVIIADVVDQYELKMQSSIEKASGEIASHIERIKNLSNSEGIEANLTGLIVRIKNWDKLVQPLQLKSMTSGIAHKTSEHIGYEIRDLSVWLHNEKGMTQQALLLVASAKEVFAEIGSLFDTFENDVDTLNGILNEDKERNHIIFGIKDIEQTVSTWKGLGESTSSYTLAANAITKSSVDALIAKTKELNARIKLISASGDIIYQSRTELCITAREGAVFAHNECHQTELALSIAKVLLAEFGDIDELRVKLTEDISALNKQLLFADSRHTVSAYQASRTSSSNTSNKGCLIFAIVIVAVIIAISIFIKMNNFSTIGNSSGNSYSYSQSTEIEFSSSATVGTDVYADIKSIFPAIGIYTEGSSNYSYFVCECRTSSSATTVWVYMSTLAYNEYFDTDASASIHISDAEEITFSSSKRIHGTVKNADSVMSGLSSDTGMTTLISFNSVN